MKRLLLLILLIAAMAVVYFVFMVTKEGFVITLTGEQLQQQLEPKFPIERRMLVLTTTFSNAKVILKEGSDRMHFSADVSANVPTQPRWTGSAEFSGGIRYDSAAGVLFLQDPQIEALTLQGVPDKYLNEIKQLGGVVAKEVFDRYPVYKLDPADYKQALAKLALKSVKVENGRLKIVLGFTQPTAGQG